MLEHAARESPDSIALVCNDEQLTYREYRDCVAAFAQELAELGAKDSRVCLLMGNSVDIAIATFAVQAAGGQVAALNPSYTEFELEPILRDARPAVLVHDAAIEEGIRILAHRLGIQNCISIGERARRLNDVPPSARGATLQLPTGEALSTVQYTGGTTGRPKGVELAHRAVAINVAQREAVLATELDQERVLAITPMYHVYAVSMGLYLAANCRGTLVIMPRYRPDAVLEAVSRHRITLLSGSPTIFTGLMECEAFETADLSSLRLCTSGASALAEETLRRWEKVTGCPICEGYGQTEAGPVLTFNPRRGTRIAGSVGVTVPLTDIEIVDVETGTRLLPAGEIGEIRARGPQIMRGYRNLPDETREALRDGWLYTGDIGFVDERNYLFIRDRKKDMVIVSGYNVYPREVEEALYAYPGVIEAAVVGRADAYRGERLVAHVVVAGSLPISADALRQHLTTRLTKYKIPDEIRIVSELPKTTVGKIDKKQLRAPIGAPEA